MHLLSRSVRAGLYIACILAAAAATSPSPDSSSRILQLCDPLIATHLLSSNLRDLLFQARPQPETAAMACQWGGHIVDQCVALCALAYHGTTSAWHFMHLQLYDVGAQGSSLA